MNQEPMVVFWSSTQDPRSWDPRITLVPEGAPEHPEHILVAMACLQDDQKVHSFPTSGEEHVTDGLQCWCHPVVELQWCSAGHIHGAIIKHHLRN